MFIAFTGEERGLLGSARYVREPLFPLDKTIAMLNMDMVGRLKDDKLIVHGTGTATEFEPLVDRLGKQFGFTITQEARRLRPQRSLVVLCQADSGAALLHRQPQGLSPPQRRLRQAEHRRHAPRGRDGGANRPSQLADSPSAPRTSRARHPQLAGGGGDRPYFGSIPDFSQDQPGYALTGVTKDGPAEKAGLKGGRHHHPVRRQPDRQPGRLRQRLRKFKAGDKVPVIVKRGKGRT